MGCQAKKCVFDKKLFARFKNEACITQHKNCKKGQEKISMIGYQD